MKVCLHCSYQFSSEKWICPSCNFQTAYKNGTLSHAPKFAENGDNGFTKDSYPQLFQLEKNNFWFRARNKLIIWALKKNKCDAKSFLEIGCGTGFVMAEISKACSKMFLTGSEIFSDGLSFAKSRVPSAKFMQMDARQVPFADEFDAIGAFDVLEHIEEDQVVLKELSKALKQKGVLLITVPQHMWLWSEIDKFSCHKRRYTQNDILRKISSTGLKVKYCTSFVSFLCPIMFLSRLRFTKNKQIKNQNAEIKINKILNLAFYLVMMFVCFDKVWSAFPF